MIDRSARDKYALIIRDFRDGLITNREYESRFDDAVVYNSKDYAITAIYSMLWYTYCDVRKHRQTGDHALTPEGKALYGRCVAFLESDEEYLWPTRDFLRPAMRAILYLVEIGRASCRERV
jgi:hypothetical protein